MILCAVLIPGEQGRAADSFHAPDAHPVAQIRRVLHGPIPEAVQHGVAFQALVVAVSGLDAGDDLELIFRLVPSEDEFSCDVRALNGGISSSEKEFAQIIIFREISCSSSADTSLFCFSESILHRLIRYTDPFVEVLGL